MALSCIAVYLVQEIVELFVWEGGNDGVRNTCADAMYAPILLRFDGYDVPLNESDRTYMRTVLGSGPVINWIESALKEKEVIEQDEAYL